jgi:hypothetical protein
MVSIVFLQRKIAIRKTIIQGKFVYQRAINQLLGFISKFEDIFCELNRGLNSCSIFENNFKLNWTPNCMCIVHVHTCLSFSSFF